MRTALVALLMAFTFNATSQTIWISADPATTAMELTDLSGTPLNANQLIVGQPILLKVPIFNLNQFNAIPLGTIIVKIGLGSKAIVDATFDLQNAPLSNYFNWSSTLNNGQIEIMGDLIAPLPGDFFGYAIFRIIPNTLTTAPPFFSTMTTNILVTNHNAPIFRLHDELDNNDANLQYSVIVAGPVPVTFGNVLVQKKGCNINVNFKAENELNVDRYEVQTSIDGIHFTTASTIPAAQKIIYIKDVALTPAMRAATIFVRVKSIDRDGSVMYSPIKTISGLCDAMLQYNIYPNPAKGSNLSLLATSGMFNGKYKLTLMDMSGRTVMNKEADLKNTTQYSMDVSNVANGKYVLRIMSADGSDKRTLQFEKL